MTTLRQYLLKYQYPDMVFDFVNLCAMVEAGLPIFLIAPVGGGKSVLIQALERHYENTDIAVQVLEKISPMRLLSIQDKINNRKALFLSEDFSTIGIDTESTAKTVLMVAKVSYDKKYIDTLFTTKKYPDGLHISVDSLAFVCGMQPLWLRLYADKEIFETLIQEKILRYYRIPIYPIRRHVSIPVLVKYLNALTLKPKRQQYDVSDYYKRILRNDLMVQTGDRAIEYVPKIIRSITRFVPEDIAGEWIKQLSVRFGFERKLLLSYYASPQSITRTNEVLHKEFRVLFHVLAHNPITLKRLALLCKVRGFSAEVTRQYASTLAGMAQKVGMIYAVRRSREVRLYPTTNMQQYSVYSWRIPHVENHISKDEDTLRVVTEK